MSDDDIDDDLLDDAFNSIDDDNQGTDDSLDEASLEDAFGLADLDTPSSNVAPEIDLMAEMAAAMEVAASEDADNPAMGAAGASSGSTAASNIAASISSSDVDIESLLKVPISLSIEVGRTKMPISQLLATKEGTIIELTRLLDEPLDILVNGSLIAHGVVVLANERFGIQITDIISLQQRALRL